jgi:hypothetical protein
VIEFPGMSEVLLPPLPDRRIARLLIAAALLLRAADSPGDSDVLPLDPPAAAGSMGPNFATAGKSVLLSWLEPLRPGAKPGEGDLALRYAAFDGVRWSEPRTVLSGGRFFANWADSPALAAASGGWLVAAWPEVSGAGDYDYNLEMARAASADGPWRRIGPANDDATTAEHGFVSLVPEGDRIRAFWLDGRQMKGDTGSMSLRTALVGQRPEKSELIDPRVCDCCQTGAAWTSEGPIVVYRDRSDGEIRDMSIVRRIDGKWTAPRPIAKDGWKIAGCPVNGPAVAASRRNVAVAWFTAAGERPRVRLAMSSDAGASFGTPAELDGASPAGRVSVVIAGNGDAIASWVAVEGKAAAIRVARVTPDGRLGKPFTVAPTSLARSSGVPKIERFGETLLVAWVEAGEPFRLRAARVALSAIPAATP